VCVASDVFAGCGEFGPAQGKALVHQESEELQDTRNLRDEDLRNLAQVCMIS